MEKVRVEKRSKYYKMECLTRGYVLRARCRLEEDSPLRRSSRSLLEKNSPRSPNARRIQQYDLSISGAATEHNLNQQEQDE